MQKRPINTRLRALLVAGVVGTTAAAGLAALTIPAHADASFSFSRLSGTDRFATAGVIDQSAYPNGAKGASVYLADGLPAHAPDALAASGLEGVNGIGVLLTDDTNTVPSSTLTALKNNKVTDIGVVGGTASVSQAQINQLKADGFTVVTPFQGSTRYQTMQMIDDSIPPASVGKDANGLPTAILASGDPAHYVDALSAGALAYAKHFPIILTNSTSSSLEPEAQQVITTLGIKDLIVVGGPASIPTSQYNPKPSGVTQTENEYGTDRSATSLALADYAISQTWLKNTNMDLARGDDGSDALAGSAFGGVNGFPTVITDSTTSVGSAPSFATEHASTLTGTSYVFGGTDAVPDAQVSDVAAAGGAAKPATAGPIAPTSGQEVNSVSGTSFTQGGLSYTYGSGDTYQEDTTTAPNPQASCTSVSYAVFQAALTQGDIVTGTYAPGSTSTFCLNDQAPNPPSTVTASPNTTAGGITVSWSAPSTAIGDGVTGYQIWRAAAGSQPISGSPTCAAAYTVSPGTSPQTPPASSSYSPLTVVPDSAGGSNGTFGYTDTTASPGSGSSANEYCYAVSAISANGAGTTQTGTAQPASPSSTPGSSADPSPVAPGTATAPSITSVSGLGHSISITYNEPVNSATVAKDGSDYSISGTITYSPTGAPQTWSAFVPSGGSGNTVILDIDFGTISGSFVVTQKVGSDGNTVCATGSTTLCAAPNSFGSGTGTAGASPREMITAASASASSGTVTLSYSEPIDCATVDTTGAQYAVSESGPGSPSAAPNVSSATCTSGASSATVTLQVTPLVVGATVTVLYNPLAAGSKAGTYVSNYGIVDHLTGGAEVVPDPQSSSGSATPISATVGP